MSKHIIWVAGLTFVIDQITKWFVVHYLDLISIRYMEVIPGFINFIMTWNSGINFGLFSGDTASLRWVWVAIAILVSAMIIYWMRRETNKIALISAGMVVGGALGNAVDRIIYGAVADALNVTCCGFHNPFSFNVADIAVFIGIIGLIIFSTDHSKKVTP